MGRVKYFIVMGITLKVNLLMERNKALEFTNTKIAAFTKESFLMI